MRKLVVLFLFIASCKPYQDESKEQISPPNISVLNTDTALYNANGIWKYHNKNYNGYIIEEDSHVIVGKLPVINGKENGTAYGWYKNGKKKYERNFLNGNREGIHKGWYKNDTLAFVYIFKNDKYEGGQKTFFKSGHCWQSLNYANGYEEGKQKSWNEDGRVINNFTVKNGKLYGVIGRYDCMSVIK